MLSGNDDEPDQLLKYVIEFPEYINNLGKRTLVIDIDLNLDKLEPGPAKLANTLPVMAEVADFSSRAPSLTASNFAALCPKDPILPV